MSRTHHLSSSSLVIKVLLLKTPNERSGGGDRENNSFRSCAAKVDDACFVDLVRSIFVCVFAVVREKK